MKRQYKELVFTNHALERLTQRHVSQSEAWATWRRPRKRYYAATKGGWVCERIWGKRQIEVVVTHNERKQPVVISVWANTLRYRQQQPTWLRFLKWIWKRLTK